MSKSIYLGVDAGGTFTDFLCLDAGPPLQIRVHKTLSNKQAPEQSILDGIKALGLDGLEEGVRLHIIHGSTVATNAVLEGNLARTALITNRGMGDILSLGRQTRPELYTLEFPPRQCPVPEQLCFEINGRLGSNGEILEPVVAEEISKLSAQLRELDIEAIAINMLFSFIDSDQEEEVAALLGAASEDWFISRSSAILPMYREYERGIATWLNAALGPVVHGYLSRLQMQTGDASLQVMQSNAETIAAGKAANLAVNLLLSGPAGGLTAMAFLGKQIGQKNFISFDMGGTSTDVALLSGAINITTEGSIAQYPVAVPMVDMQTIGAGGGSIAFVDAGGMLQVGPRSAGADPGPACYGRGGKQATVTDANLVLGRLLPSAGLAGDLSLDLDAARCAIATLAEQLAMEIEETALGIITVANEHMARAIRLISVNRGYDPADFLLASFGGAGALHVCAIADAMKMPEAIVPVYGGVLSALGMLVANQGRQFTRTVNIVLNASAQEQVTAEFQQLQAQGEAELLSEGASKEALQVRWRADLRYRGQSYTLNVPFGDIEQARGDFAKLHQQRYGYCLNTDTELVNLLVNVFVAPQSFSLPKHQASACNKAEQTAVYGHGSEVPVWPRETLAEGVSVSGPAIITEYAATTFVDSGWIVSVDHVGNLRLRKTTKD